MINIGVLSDTHITLLDELSPGIVKGLNDVDWIVHAGDFVGLRVLEGLRSLKPVKAVRGNMDSFEIRDLLPDTDVFKVKGKSIGIVHGSGPPWGIEQRVREKFGDVDVIIYGHSHEARNELYKGALLFNPGQCKNSYGLLKIGEDVAAEIIRV